MCGIPLTVASCFNPRARTGRDAVSFRAWSSVCVFQSTRPHGERRGQSTAHIVTYTFQSTRPHGARLGWRTLCGGHFGFQSTRPHGARRGEHAEPFDQGIVSIHAPARGATMRKKRFRTSSKGFNPRARTGRDQRTHGGVFGVLRFNPRARTGRDTSPDSCPGSPRKSFNPRARTGRDAAPQPPAASSTCFNPRARTGRDQQIQPGTAMRFRFQSTRPHGARRDGEADAVRGSVFQSTRPHGARPPAPLARKPRQPVSIHAPARGATPCFGGIDLSIKFQSTRPHGARPMFHSRGHTLKEFQSTRPHGARHERKVHRSRIPCFNPRARTGRDFHSR